MTPEDVATRARELKDQEVLLTVRGVVRQDHHGVLTVGRSHCAGVLLQADPELEPLPDLWDIRPAPMRIVPRQLYADGHGRLWRGLADDRVADIEDVPFGAMSPPLASTIPGLHPVKVVPA